MRKAEVKTNKTINTKSHMLLASADDTRIDIIGLTLREDTAVFSKIEKESANVGLTVNEDKTTLMVSTNRDSSRPEQHVNVDKRYIFELVNEFIYLGSAVSNRVSLEIKRIILLANR